MRTVEELAEEILGVHGYEGKFYSSNGKERVYLNHKTFTQFIEKDDGDFIVKVYIKDKKLGEKQTKEEIKKCLERRDALIEELNNIPLSVEIINNYEGGK